MIPRENVIDLWEESSALQDDSSHVSLDYEVEIISEKPPQTMPKQLRRKRPIPTFPSTFPTTRTRTRDVVAEEENDQKWWWKSVWKIKSPIKQKVFLWLVLANKILTWDNCKKRAWHGT